MENTMVELPTRIFPGGEMRIWSEPGRNRGTILLLCHGKDFEFNRDVRNELRRIWYREVVEPFMCEYPCQIWRDMVRLGFPTKDLTQWLELMRDVCERQEPQLVRLTKKAAR
jgi:hypothetical protein